MKGSGRDQRERATLADELGRLRRYLAFTGALLVALDPRGRVKYVNPRVGEVLGYGPEELVGRDWFDTCLPPEERDSVRGVFDAIIADDATLHERHENDLLTRDGRRRTVAWSNSLLRDPEGNISGTLSSGLDVTEQRRAEADLAEGERAWATLVENLPGAVYRCDPEPPFAFTFASEHIRDLTGYGSEELVGGGICCLNLIDPEDREGVLARVSKALTEDRAFQVTYRLRHRDGGERWVWEQGVGVRGPDGELRFIEGVLTDITEQRRAEEAARHLQAQLAHADRLATIGQMAARTAHELGQPLFAIGNYVRAVLRRLKGGTRADEVVAEVEQMGAQAERAQAVIRGILDFARNDPGHRERCDLNDVVSEALQFARPEALRHRARIRFEPAEGPLPVEVNRVQVAQVVLNLLRNGLEAMADTGEPPEVVVATHHDGGAEVEVRVTDHGPGLGDRAPERLFEPFYTTKPEGVGLGLAICHSLVGEHGGRIEAAPNRGGGTTFRFTLPYAPENNAEPPPNHG